MTEDRCIVCGVSLIGMTLVSGDVLMSQVVYNTDSGKTREYRSCMSPTCHADFEAAVKAVEPR